MTNVWIEPVGHPETSYTEEQFGRAKGFADQDRQATRAQVAARFSLGDVCGEIVEQSGIAAYGALVPLARELGYAPETLERYVRVAKLAGPELRERLAVTSVLVPWTCVTIACVTDPTERIRRVAVLLGRLDSAERMKWPVSLDATEFRRSLGLPDSPGGATGAAIPGDIVAQLGRGEVREAVLAELTKSPAAVLQVLREPAVREVLKDRDVARFVREQLRPAPSPEEELVNELVGADEHDPRADWTIKYFDLAHQCRELLLLGPEDFVNIDDPDIWQSVESIRDSVTSWANRVLQQRPRTIRLLTGK
ncbi:hypothetical protein [Streptomyces sp. NPDC001665]